MVLRKLLSLASLFESKIFIVQRSIEIVNFTEHMMLDLHLPTLRLYVRYKSNFKISQRYLHFLKVTSDTSLQEKRTKARFQSESENSLTSSWHFYEIYKSGIEILFSSLMTFSDGIMLAGRYVSKASSMHKREVNVNGGLDKISVRRLFHSPRVAAPLSLSFSVDFMKGFPPLRAFIFPLKSKMSRKWSKNTCFW